MATKRKTRAPVSRPLTPDQITYDVALGQRSFDALAGLRAAVPRESPAMPKLDPQDVATLVIGIARRIAEPSIRKRFENVERELAREVVDRLEPAAWALWHATQRRSVAVAATSDALVPMGVVTESTALKSAMLRVVQYHLDEVPGAAEEIAAIVSGQGHADLASDLDRLAQLYEDHAELLAEDTRRYRAADALRARELAQAIVSAMGAQSSDTAADALRRAFVVLDETYAPIRAFGLAIFRLEGGEEMFPSLFSVRAPRSTRPAAPGGEPGPAQPEPSQG